MEKTYIKYIKEMKFMETSKVYEYDFRAKGLANYFYNSEKDIYMRIEFIIYNRADTDNDNEYECNILFKNNLKIAFEATPKIPFLNKITGILEMSGMLKIIEILGIKIPEESEIPEIETSFSVDLLNKEDKIKLYGNFLKEKTIQENTKTLLKKLWLLDNGNRILKNKIADGSYIVLPARRHPNTLELIYKSRIPSGIFFTTSRSIQKSITRALELIDVLSFVE